MGLISFGGGGGGVGLLSTCAGILSQMGLLFWTEVPGMGLPVSSRAHQQ